MPRIPDAGDVPRVSTAGLRDPGLGTTPDESTGQALSALGRRLSDLAPKAGPTQEDDPLRDEERAATRLAAARTAAEVSAAEAGAARELAALAAAPEDDDDIAGALARFDRAAEDVGRRRTAALPAPEARGAFEGTFARLRGAQRESLRRTMLVRAREGARTRLADALAVLADTAAAADEETRVMLTARGQGAIAAQLAGGTLAPEEAAAMERGFVAGIGRARARRMIEADPQAAAKRLEDVTAFSELDGEARAELRDYARPLAEAAGRDRALAAERAEQERAMAGERARHGAFARLASALEDEDAALADFAAAEAADTLQPSGEREASAPDDRAAGEPETGSPDRSPKRRTESGNGQQPGEPWPETPISRQFREAIHEQESAAANYQAVNRQDPENPALGRYQLRNAILQDIGMKDSQGDWTGKYGVHSEEDFLADPAAQERAFADAVTAYEQQLRAKGATDHIGQEIEGLEARFAVADSGLVAAAHRAGAAQVKNYLEHQRKNGWKSDFSGLTERLAKEFKNVETRLRLFETIGLSK